MLPEGMLSGTAHSVTGRQVEANSLEVQETHWLFWGEVIWVRIRKTCPELRVSKRKCEQVLAGESLSSEPGKSKASGTRLCPPWALA